MPLPSPFVALLDRANHARAWQRVSILLGPDCFRAPSLDRLLALTLHRLGRMGVAERELLEHKVQPGMTVLDVGANQGVFTVLLSRLVGPEGKVHAFEPDPVLFAALTENCRRNGCVNVTLHPVALGVVPSDDACLHRSLFNSGDNRLSGPLTGAVGAGVGVSGRVARLGDVLPPDTTVDFAKVDVQGWEMEVFRGMEEMLVAGNPRQIFFEYWPEGLRRAGTDPAELLRYLEACGYAVRPEATKDGVAVLDAGFPRAVPAAEGAWAFTNFIATWQPAC